MSWIGKNAWMPLRLCDMLNGFRFAILTLHFAASRRKQELFVVSVPQVLYVVDF